ncbi:hypothetical protein RCH23_003298 [Cryobacterium sp. CAN_C3]|nr:hypothetical protein [Cryobacterium sp. CAN_C3]
MLPSRWWRCRQRVRRASGAGRATRSRRPCRPRVVGRDRADTPGRPVEGLSERIVQGDTGRPETIAVAGDDDVAVQVRIRPDLGAHGRDRYGHPARQRQGPCHERASAAEQEKAPRFLGGLSSFVKDDSAHIPDRPRIRALPRQAPRQSFRGGNDEVGTPMLSRPRGLVHAMRLRRSASHVAGQSKSRLPVGNRDPSWKPRNGGWRENRPVNSFTINFENESGTSSRSVFASQPEVSNTSQTLLTSSSHKDTERPSSPQVSWTPSIPSRPKTSPSGRSVSISEATPSVERRALEYSSTASRAPKLLKFTFCPPHYVN